MENINNNPKNNIGAIFLKGNDDNPYFLIKVTLNGENHTLVGFKNQFYETDSKNTKPYFYVFPYKKKTI